MIKEILEDKYPTTNTEAWSMYPKCNRVQQTTVLFDFQQIEWSPFKTSKCMHAMPMFNTECNVGNIYTRELSGDHITSAVAINKGDIKWLVHYNQDTLVAEQEIRGSLELRIGAFVTTAFKKFSGVVSFKSVGEDVVTISLAPDMSFLESLNDVTLNKNIKRLYNRRDWQD